VIPDASVLWVILIVLTLSVVLDRLIFRPVTRVMREREGAIRAARELADTSAAQARAAMAEFEAKTTAARTDVYRQMDEKRRAALDHRAALLAQTRQEMEAELGAAAAQLRAQADAARASLDRDADALASAVVERVLGRAAS
jgi:F-type H+-transporting ATPase subunit b